VGAVVLGYPSSMAAFAATTASTGNSWAVPNYVYPTEVVNLAPYLYWRLDEDGRVVGTAADSSGNGRDGDYNPKGNPANFDWLQNGGALITDVPDNAIGLAKSSSCINTLSTTATAAPSTFSLVIWFKAAAGYAMGGKILGFENPRTGVATPPTGAYDRMLYMDGNGRVWFGVNNGGIVGVSSAPGLNDGSWHMAAATFGAAGMRLYVDGVLVASNATTTANAYNGFWRVGCGNLAGWAADWTGANPPPAGTTPASNETFMGGVDEAAVFTTQLTTQQVQFLYWIR
jgi:hypothetical protein